MAEYPLRLFDLKKIMANGLLPNYLLILKLSILMSVHCVTATFRETKTCSLINAKSSIIMCDKIIKHVSSDDMSMDFLIS